MNNNEPNPLIVEHLNRIKKLLITWASIGYKLYEAYQLVKQKYITKNIETSTLDAKKNMRKRTNNKRLKHTSERVRKRPLKRALLCNNSSKLNKKLAKRIDLVDTLTSPQLSHQNLSLNSTIQYQTSTQLKSLNQKQTLSNIYEIIRRSKLTDNNNNI